MTSAAMAIDDVERLQARLTALEQERKHLLAVIEILQDIGGSLHFAEVVQSVALRLGETFGLDRCSIFLAERGGGSVRLVASYEDPGIRNYVVDLDRYPELRRALQTGETVFIADAATDPSAGPGTLGARGAEGQDHHRHPDLVAGRRHRRDLPPHLPRRPQLLRRRPPVLPGRGQPHRQGAPQRAPLRAPPAAEGRGRGRPPPRAGAGRAARLHAAPAGQLPGAVGRRATAWPTASTAEIERLVGVAQAVLSQESTAR